MITKPTVHLNGTSRHLLIDGYEAAYIAVGAAFRAIEAVEMNARDYYVQGPDAFKQALHEHNERLRKLLEIKKELLEIYEAVEPSAL